MDIILLGKTLLHGLRSILCSPHTNDYNVFLVGTQIQKYVELYNE